MRKLVNYLLKRIHRYWDMEKVALYANANMEIAPVATSLALMLMFCGVVAAIPIMQQRLWWGVAVCFAVIGCCVAWIFLAWIWSCTSPNGEGEDHA